MVSSRLLQPIAQRLSTGGALIPDTPQNLLEVVGILKSYGVVLSAYSRNLLYIADHQFLELFPFFKYFDGEFSWSKLFRHWWHDRINYEFAEYCMKAMLWHGGGGLDHHLDSPEFKERCQQAIALKLRHNPIIKGLHLLFPDFLPEQIRQLAYTSGLGQFWRVMSAMFLHLSDRYDQGEITTIPQVVDHVLQALVEAANKPITYAPEINGQRFDLIPATVGLTFLADTAVPYVEAVFFRSFPFMGTISYNAQAHQIPVELENFTYGALYADPLPVGSAGIPPTLLMQDMRHHLPDYLLDIYRRSLRGEDDLRVQICQSFQKSMFCVTSAVIRGLAPYPLNTQDPEQQKSNQPYLEGWLNRLSSSVLLSLQDEF
ncbi:MAG: CO2 hydration protein [Cyanobacteriota bacterium]|nr:CO2 hydration protein [Cyanobacteriota bacterium]